MSSRDSILERVREALQSAPESHLLERDAESRHGLDGVRQVLPKVPDDLASQVALFAERSESLKTEFVSCADETAAIVELKRLANREKWESVAFPADSEIERLAGSLSLSKLEVNRTTVKTELEKASAGVTGCDALVAQTGSVLLTTKSGGGRALSVLPPHHVVIAFVSQLVPDLPAAFEVLERKYAPNFPSFMTFITGPSRTGDIERVLVLGAHGPRKLTVILVGGEGMTPRDGIGLSVATARPANPEQVTGQ